MMIDHYIHTTINIEILSCSIKTLIELMNELLLLPRRQLKDEQDFLCAHKRNESGVFNFVPS